MYVLPFVPLCSGSLTVIVCSSPHFGPVPVRARGRPRALRPPSPVQRRRLLPAREAHLAAARPALCACAACTQRRYTHTLLTLCSTRKRAHTQPFLCDFFIQAIVYLYSKLHSNKCIQPFEREEVTYKHKHSLSHLIYDIHSIYSFILLFSNLLFFIFCSFFVYSKYFDHVLSPLFQSRLVRS